VAHRTRLPTLLIGTTSAGKLREFQEILGELPVRLATLLELGIDLDVEEGDESFAENAALKARAFHAASGLLTIAEDSGFVVDALDGEPGVWSARWGGTDDYSVKNRLILERLSDVPWAERGCGYVSHLAIVTCDGRLYRRSGSCRGYVAREPAGSGGFGYDPIFFVPRLDRTMAELSPEEKHRISHRGRAARRALPLLRSLLAGGSGRAARPVSRGRSTRPSPPAPRS
jgi:XTP/dITP diphosphohydrolase